MNPYTAIAFVFVASVNVVAQVPPRPTIPELVSRQTEGPVVLIQIVELVPEPLDTLIKTADLILYGVVSRNVTYLSEDERDLFTDSTIMPIRVVVQRNVSTSARPGLPAPVVVKRWGGQAVINGIQVSQEQRNLRALTAGEEVFLFLVYDASSQKYQLPGGLSGAFAVAGGRLQDLVHHQFYKTFDGMAVDQLVPEIQRTASGVIR
jgi:hypothetical protein